MANNLYPVFDIPDLDEDAAEEQQVMKAGPLFDFKLGDFVLDGQNRVVYVNGKDQYMLWCVKALSTQLGSCEAYPGFGIDADGAADQPTREVVQSEIERTIVEALAENDATEEVHEFTFDWNGSALYVSFVVEPKDWEAFDINVSIQQ